MNRNNNNYMSSLPSRSRGGYQYNQTPTPPPISSNTYVNQTENNNSNKITLPPVITNPGYLQGYLRTQIGRYMKVNFLLGTSTFVDKAGVLKDVGVDHVILTDPKTGDDIVADLYSIKFIDIPNER